MDRHTNKTTPKVETFSEPGSQNPRSPQLNEKDFDQLHHKYRDRLVSSVKRIVGDKDKAEDVVSKAFQVAWEKRDTFRAQSSPYTWLTAIARNQALDLVRQPQNNRLEPMDDKLADQQLASPGQVGESHEPRADHIHLRRVMDRLPERHRRVLEGHYFEGRSMKDLALRESIPVGTVLSRLDTARELVRRLWNTIDTKQKYGRQDDRSQKEGEMPRNQKSKESKQEQGESKSPDADTWDR